MPVTRTKDEWLVNGLGPVPAAYFCPGPQRLDSSKQARETELIGGAMTAHNFSPNPLDYDYDSDYADYSDDYYEYEHMQEVRV